MVAKLKVVKVGDCLGVTISRTIAAALKIEEGDTLFLTEAPDGFRLTFCDADSEAQMESARKIMKSRRDALRLLTK